MRSPEREKGEGLEGLIRDLMEESRERWGRVESSLEVIRRELEELKGREERWKLEKEEIKKKNILIKGLKVEGKDADKEIEELCRKLEVKVHVEVIRKVKMGGEGRDELLILKLGSEEEKKEMLWKKKLLKRSKVWVEEDLTWKERRMKWDLKDIGREEELKGGKVWIGYNKININGEWWFWDEDGGNMRDWKGNRRRGEMRNKDMEFWEAFRDRDIIFLMETWLDEKGWDKIRGRLSTGFR
ncbi:hypothetical protein RF55_12247 [Lasius niger]|uniref:Uncharacterized protein n=1 Tax=Lasius niger TaxID=67767 RepID=A0A0J7KCW9_LASNI|nr:hypothetical protein RF55_12247 [Lasius niger]